MITWRNIFVDDLFRYKDYQILDPNDIYDSCDKLHECNLGVESFSKKNFNSLEYDISKNISHDSSKSEIGERSNT